MLDGWRAAGDTHLLVFDLGLDFVVDHQEPFAAYAATFRDALAGVAEPIWSDGAYTLYAWTAD